MTAVCRRPGYRAVSPPADKLIGVFVDPADGVRRLVFQRPCVVINSFTLLGSTYDYTKTFFHPAKNTRGCYASNVLRTFTRVVQQWVSNFRRIVAGVAIKDTPNCASDTWCLRLIFLDLL